MYTLIQTAKPNDVDPQVWLADVLARIADHPITGLAALLPWNWKKSRDITLHNPQPPPNGYRDHDRDRKAYKIVPSGTSVESRLLPWQCGCLDDAG
jgi:IS66 C-terminal element